MSTYAFLPPHWILCRTGDTIDIVALGSRAALYTGAPPLEILATVSAASVHQHATEPVTGGSSRTRSELTIEQKSNTLSLFLRRKLSVGLDLKPVTAELELQEDAERVIEIFSGLAHDWAFAVHERDALRQENAVQNQVVEDMVQEKEKFQEMMLNKVTAIIDERNAQIDALRSGMEY